MKFMRLVSRGARILGKTTIVLFCLWHAGALFIHTLPPAAAGMIPDALRSHVSPIVNPYMMANGQWQNWDLFSPDPMRRISRYRVVALQENIWTTLRILEPATARFWRSSGEFSYPLQLEDGGATELFSRYLRALCTPLGLTEGTPVALMVDYAILPESPPENDWAAWRKDTTDDWDQWTAAVTPCPAIGDPAMIPMNFL